MPKLSELLNFDNPDQPITVEVPIEMIVVPEGTKLSFDKKDAKNQALMGSMEREGLLQPIGLRWVSDEKLEVVWGRRRLWIAKQLKWPTILAHIGLWKANETKLASVEENICRAHLNQIQIMNGYQTIFSEVEKTQGKVFGRRPGGLVRARRALRDPKTKKFLAAPKEDQPSNGELFNTKKGDDNSGGEPATATVAVAGSIPISEEGTNVGDEDLGLAKAVATRTGVSVRTTRNSAKVLKELTDDQRRVLATCNHVSMKDMLKLASMKDKERRDIAVKLVIMNNKVDDAITLAMSDDDAVMAALEHKKETSLNDNDWVKTYCANLYQRLENPEPFRRAAILYRHTLDLRAACAVKLRKIVEKEHQDYENQYSWSLRGFCWISHPDKWVVCWKCAGRKKQDPSCSGCKGEGFHLKYDWPKRK
jgi:ParB-like nuclease domain